MDIDLQQQYSTMISNVISDKTDAAKAVLSNILSAKLAQQLQMHNVHVANLNRTAMADNTIPPTV